MRKVGLFVTCLADLFRPRTAFAAAALLERAGCDVEVPRLQTCCGQPAYNSGDTQNARRIARRVISAFETFDYVVAPSGSCAGTIKLHYPDLFADDPAWRTRAENLAARTCEIVSFLADVCSYSPRDVALAASATYHDTCSGLRELKIERQPRALLSSVKGLRLIPLPDVQSCCGFGGTFCVKYPSISNAIVDEKATNIESTKADLLLGGDLGCLMNMAGKLRRRGSAIRAFHVAEILAGMGDGPAIGEEP
ncbi:(Fe-S)-binding protein [Methylocapsa palsarum]|uniref:L-lactate dehydrogenase complex protein LldE n=1 Tax=Methylocapsa palsarum TaxID=1612308 RepID=A0A1I4B1M6_9HYPH|nr:(Fe-S)-binding protein [Methylocapsa palsarum]SFK61756.1 L-lactate dehydrogenase complex protein LldE [Methylocapsa palsarum]